MEDYPIVDVNDPVLVTGAAGFIGSAVVEALIARGFRRVRCLVRPGGSLSRLDRVLRTARPRIDLVKGNLLSRGDCAAAVTDATVIFHLAAGRGANSFADA